MIVKVQISQASSDGLVHMLVYDKAREHIYEDEATQEVLDLMGDKKKAFFQARMIDDPEQVGKKKIVLKSEVPEQEW